ncbi:hypothetical protein K438DRAFT_1795953 [Mycena galopus ATCC 62051]|nr:hypothetical protein K438DRAFT_1795953 [Mycena galopus ATCC 62051]
METPWSSRLSPRIAGSRDLQTCYSRWYTHEGRVSQVCSDWRQVAHSTPQLWSGNLRIDFGRDYGEVYADGLNQWLARSALLPIPISLWVPSNNLNIGDRLLEDVLNITPRYRALRLRGICPPASLLNQVLARLAQSRGDVLEVLDLGTKRGIGNIAGGLVIPAPRLYKLRICIPTNSSLILLPWAQLMDLTLTVYQPNIAPDVIAQCANLLRASIATPAWGPLPRKYRRPYPHTLSLDILTSVVHHAVKRWTEAHFTPFQLCAPNITQLELDSSDLTSDDLRVVIRHAPSITHLTLRWCNHCLDDALVDSLYYENGMTPCSLTCTISASISDGPRDMGLQKLIWRV